MGSINPLGGDIEQKGPRVWEDGGDDRVVPPEALVSLMTRLSFLQPSTE